MPLYTWERNPCEGAFRFPLALPRLDAVSPNSTNLLIMQSFLLPFSLRRGQSSLGFDLLICYFSVLCLKSCHPNPCQHGARCVENTSTSVKCICLPGWKGQYRKKQTIPHGYSIILLLLLSGAPLFGVA